MDHRILAPTMKRKDLFEIWQSEKGKDATEKCQHLQNHIKNRLVSEGHSEKTLKEMEQRIYQLCTQFSKRWQAARRTEKDFLQKNDKWLNEDFLLPFVPVQTSADEDSSSTSHVGRPEASFAECSDRTKRRKTQSLREEFSPEALAYAAQMSLRTSGQRDSAKLISEIIDTTPTRASRIRHAWENREKNVPMMYTPDEALALFIDTKLTKSQYQKIRIEAKLKNANIYPSYNHIRLAKEKCYPSKALVISECVAEIDLQALLDHTAQRIIESQKEVFDVAPLDMPNELTLITKWGCDGSTGHSEYKQKFLGETSDSDMFITSLVPIQLFGRKSNGQKIIVWQNPRTSSVRYCRPIRIQFKKETTNLTREEVEYIENQIANLQVTQINAADKNIIVSHNMMLTMIDGKVCNAVTSTSSAQKCYVCGATPTQMNKLDSVVQRAEDEGSFRFGLSTLHAWIRFFECFLHISYRINIKKWQVRGKEDSEAFKARKNEVQTAFKNELGLIVDKVRPGGSGTSNDGNTARRFFRNYHISSRITGIDETLIRRCGIILEALASGFTINVEAFGTFAYDTAKLYVEKYPWYYMPASVHKILIHGRHIIESALLPIGQLSEEAQESRNKDLKAYRRGHTRKSSRQLTNIDLFNMLLVSSDPLITGLRRLPYTSRKAIDPETIALLAAPDEIERISESLLTSSEDETSASETTSDTEDSS